MRSILSLAGLAALASCGSIRIPHEVSVTDAPAAPEAVAVQVAAATPSETSALAPVPLGLELRGLGLGIDPETGYEWSEADWREWSEPAAFRQSKSKRSVNLGVLLGARAMSDDQDWQSNLDQQLMAGAEASFMLKHMPIGIELGVLTSFTSEDVQAGSITLDTDVRLYEFFAGGRVEFGIPEGGFVFFAGAGVNAIMTYVEARETVTNVTTDDNDTTLGGYLHGGMEIMVSDNVGIGFDLRAAFADKASLFNSEADPSYYQGALLIGFHF
ncbi:MAG: outer membrane beta-barrel protein [Planctomycetota bacterium]